MTTFTTNQQQQPEPGLMPVPKNLDPRDKIRQPTGDPRNPFGLGDPEDLTLRKVEKEILVPQIMRDRAKQEKCSEVVKEFSECCKAAGVLMVISCRSENSRLKSCLTKWYKDDEFIQECTQIYLAERSRYRRTGIKLKDMARYLA